MCMHIYWRGKILLTKKKSYTSEKAHLAPMGMADIENPSNIPNHYHHHKLRLFIAITNSDILMPNFARDRPRLIHLKYKKVVNINQV